MNDIEKKHRFLKESFFRILVTLLLELEWNKSLFQLIEEKCNFSKNYYHILFPAGEVQIIEEFEEWQDKKMLESLTKQESKINTVEKIAKALELRIISTASQTATLKVNALFLLPWNVLLGFRLYMRTCDIIWRYAGDRSHDFNYYSKRSLLFSVYVSARLLYLSDDSREFIKTKNFITFSLKTIVNIGSVKTKIKFPSVKDIPVLRVIA